VGEEPELAARIPLDDRAPQLEALVVFAGIHPQITGLEQLACGTILDDGAARQPRLGILLRLAKRELNRQRAPKAGQQKPLDTKTPPWTATLS
jgi:hypothetical protein